MQENAEVSPRAAGAAYKRPPGRPRIHPIPCVQTWDGRVLAMAALFATTIDTDPHVVPVHNRPRQVDAKGDIWTARDWMVGEDRGVLLTCQRQYHAGGKDVEHWFWRIEDLKAVALASGGARRIEV